VVWLRKVTGSGGKTACVKGVCAMRYRTPLLAGLMMATALGAAGCKKHAAGAGAIDKDKQAALLAQLIDAKPGDVISIPAGTIHFDTSLSLNVDGVTVRGAGKDATILDFSGLVNGAEGMLVHASNFTIEGLTLQNTKGDALKINEGENIIIRGVRAQWTGGPSTKNGAYGLYPVQTKNLLVEDSEAIGASDAGIYVGQSQNIVVRNNKVRQNVAGIEIENSTNADVYDNEATANTGGILVFNMPNLPVPGRATRVFHNRSYANNTANFGARGTAVASVPAGTGVIVNSNPQVEIFDNDIADNQTANLIISSYFSTGYMNKTGVAAAYDPYPSAIYVYGNRFKGGGDSPDGVKLQALRVAMFGVSGHIPDILWDGYVDKAKLVDGKLDPSRAICVDNGDAGVLNADGPNGYKNPSLDKAPYACTLPKLPAVELTGKLGEAVHKS
jgi:parallel beta-helix repeat protein